MKVRPRVGISACLLGEPVRWDGGDKRDRRLLATLGRLVTWVPVCPEVELGLGVPRDPIRLVRSPRAPRLRVQTSGVDLTLRMRRFADRRLDALAGLGLDGYVLKARSPSCGLRAVPVHGPGGRVRHTGRGLFAARLRMRLPSLPVEEEGRLVDPAIRRRFIARINRRAKTRLRRPAGIAYRRGRSGP